MAHVAGKADLTEHDAVLGQGLIQRRGDERRRGGEVRGRLRHPEATRYVQVDIAVAETKPTSGFQHRQHHGQPAVVPSDHRAARRSVSGRSDQGLELHQDRARAFDAGEHRRARRSLSAFVEEQGGGVLHLAQARVAHLEHADLVGGAETVLGGAQDAEGIAALTFEGEHGVDHVLHHTRAGDLAVLGDVADQHDRDAPLLGQSHQLGRRAPAPG